MLLYQTPLSDDAKERLKAMAETTDGFVLAEKDLELRGPAISSARASRDCRR